LEEVLQRAAQARPDWKSQEARLKNARLLTSASKWERAPSVAAFGDYGASGSSPANSLPTRAVGVQVRLPVFDGGRRDARRAETNARLREEEHRARDLRQQIELEVRLALDALESAQEQVAVAGEALTQAERELEQARRRYQAGVANSLELTRAQSTVEQARSNSIDSLFRYNAARIDLAQASGDVASAIP
jgi:outer membrane protein TolC